MPTIKKLPKTAPPSIKAGSIVDRRGGLPAHLLNGDRELSSREQRKKALAEHFESKAARRK